MASKDNFNAREWSLLREAPPLAGFHVIASERGGTGIEAQAIAATYGDVREHQWRPDGSARKTLLDELVADLPGVNQERFGTPSDQIHVEQVANRGLECLGEAVELLERKASTEDVEQYRRFVANLAQRVAHAHKKRSLSNLRGQRVSDAESSAVQDVLAALGVEDDPSYGAPTETDDERGRTFWPMPQRDREHLGGERHYS